MNDVLIIIPAFNEELGLGAVLDNLADFDAHVDVLVVNDGSQDQTANVAKQHRVFLASHPINLGYGASIQTGYRFAISRNYPYVVLFDADGQHSHTDLQYLIAEIRKGKDDIIIGSRVLGDPNFAPGIRKRIAVFWFKTIIRLFTGKAVTDPTSGLRGLSAKAVSYCAKSISFPNDFPDADMIIQFHFQGLDVREFPVRSLERKQGKSMHTGIYRHMIYMLKVTISIVGLVVYQYTLRKRDNKHG